MGCGGRGGRSHPSGTCSGASGDPGLRAGRGTHDRARAQVAGWPSGASAPSCPRNCRINGMLLVSPKYPCTTPSCCSFWKRLRPWAWDAPASTGLGVLTSPASMSPRAAVSLWVLTRAFSLPEAHQGKRSPPRPVRWPALGVQLRARGAGQPASGHPRALPRHVALQVTGVDLFCTFSFCPLTIWENNLSTTCRVAKTAKQSLSLYSLLSLDLHG